MPSTHTIRPRFDHLPLEEVRCYLCASNDGLVIVDDPPFKVRLCSGCGLGYTSPRVHADHLHKIYDSTYFSSDRAEAFGYACYEADLSGYLKTFRKKARTILKYQPRGKLLEVGCAAGAFLKVMHEEGFDVCGLEVSPDILEVARSKFGIENVRQGTLASADFGEERFDLIAMFDVIEHVADPILELTRCRNLLQDRGIVVLQTQNIASMTRRLLGARWHHFKQLEHIYHFSPKTIARILNQAGFDVLLNTKRRAGKYVSLDDIADRAHRVARIPKFLCGPLRLLGRRFVYVNPLDEMFVIARARPRP